MPNLEEWQENEEGAFPCLETLKLTKCHQLRQMPHSNSFPKVTSLSISDSAIVSLPWLPSLKELSLFRLGDLEELCCDVVVAGEAHFPHLQRLHISSCPKMRRWPNMLPVLTQLDASDCWGFNQLLPPRLPALSSLSLCKIPILTSMPRGTLQALIQLKDLRIRQCYALVTLQDEDLPATLTTLEFGECRYLKSLPRGLHALTSLRILEINDCPRVTCLPEGGLPSSLERLEIYGCRILEERCMEEEGEDWPKISHVPDKCIGLSQRFPLGTVIPCSLRSDSDQEIKFELNL